MTLPIHPAALMLPELSDDEYTALVEDIGANGLYHAIVLCNGAILDGRHRERAIAEIEANGGSVVIHPPCRYKTYTGDPYAYVVSMNTRRHLSHTQRICVAIAYGDAVAEGRATLDVPRGAKRRDVLAQRFRVCGRRLQDAMRVREMAPALYEAMESGGLSVEAALKQATGQGDGVRVWRCPSCGVQFDPKEAQHE